jgi:hypothetical protein
VNLTHACKNECVSGAGSIFWLQNEQFVNIVDTTLKEYAWQKVQLLEFYKFYKFYQLLWVQYKVFFPTLFTSVSAVRRPQRSTRPVSIFQTSLFCNGRVFHFSMCEEKLEKISESQWKRHDTSVVTHVTVTSQVQSLSSLVQCHIAYEWHA